MAEEKWGHERNKLHTFSRICWVGRENVFGILSKIFFSIFLPNCSRVHVGWRTSYERIINREFWTQWKVSATMNTRLSIKLSQKKIVSKQQARVTELFTNVAYDLWELRRCLSFRVSLSADFAYFSIKFLADIHLHRRTRQEFAHSVQWASLAKCLFPFSINEENLLRFAFHRRKFNFLLKELCQNAAGAVSTCFIYSSAFKRFFLFPSFVLYAQTSEAWANRSDLSMWNSRCILFDKHFRFRFQFDPGQYHHRRVFDYIFITLGIKTATISSAIRKFIDRLRAHSSLVLRKCCAAL